MSETTTRGKRAVAYIRVSTDKEEQKSSLANQREFFERYIVDRGDTLVHIYCDEGKSATKMANRKALNTMIAAAKNHEFDILYVKDVSRLFRNTQDFVNVTTELRNMGIDVFYVDLGQHVDPLVLHIFAVMAQSESEKMSTRIKFAKQLSKEKGIVPNFVFGYDRIDKWTLVPNPEEAATVRTVFNLYTEQGWGQARIAKYLHENGYKTKKMKEDAWSCTTVGEILKNQLYIGKVVNGRQTTKGALTNARNEHSEDEWYVVERPEFRLITDEQWEKAQQIRVRNGKMFPHNRNTRRSEKHLFSNLIKCGCCGFSYRRNQRQHVENGPVYVWWNCSKRCAYGTDRCTAEHIRINEDWLLEAIKKLLNSMVTDKKKFYTLIEKKCAEIISAYLEETEQYSVEELNTQLSELEAQRSRIKDMVRRGMIDMDEAERDMMPINRQVEQIKFKLSEISSTTDIIQEVKAKMKKTIANFGSIEWKDDIGNCDLRKVIEKIVVVSKQEIYVYFRLDGESSVSFPVKLSDSINYDTNTSHGTQRSAATAE